MWILRQEWTVETLGRKWEVKGTSINHAHLEDAMRSSLITLFKKSRLEYDRRLIETEGSRERGTVVGSGYKGRCKEEAKEPLREARKMVELC